MQSVGKFRDGVAELPIRSRFKVLTDTELESIPPIEWLVDHLLPGGAASALIGPAASGKTFVAVDLALSIAAGLPWCGRNVSQGDVLYVAAEGHRGLRMRELAWKEANGVDTVPRIGFICEPVQLLHRSDIDSLLLAIDRFAAEPKLVVIDTFARCFLGGDENSATDVGLVVETMRQLQEKTGTSVLVVHHSRKGDTVERGSGALRAGLEAVINVAKDGPHVAISCSKMKDAAEFSDVDLLLVSHRDSCVLRPVSDDSPDLLLDETRKTVLKLLDASGLRHGQWEQLAIQKGVSEPTFNRSRKILLKLGLVTHEGTIYRRTSSEALPNGTTSTQSNRTGTVEPSSPKHLGLDVKDD